MVKSFFKPKKREIDANYWREIWWSKKKAKEALVNLMVPINGKLTPVKELILSNGNTIPVQDVTEEQAHDFMKQICPSWTFPKDEPRDEK